MKKSILIFCSMAVGSIGLMAQNIDGSNFIRPAALNDTAYEANSSSVSPATTGSNQMWDFSNLIDAGNSLVLIYKDAKDSTTGYPQVLSYGDRTFAGFAATTPSAEFYSLNAAGYYLSAYYIAGLQESLSAATGNPGDELVIPRQRITYPDTLFYLKFPVTSQSSWTSTRTRDAQFTVSIASAGLSQTPGFFREITEETRTVVGDGQIIIPDENGNALPAIDAFLIEVDGKIIDSTYLGGAPAPPQLLASFGLTQGIRETYTHYVIYASNGGENALVAYSLDVNGNVAGFVYRPRAARAALSVGIAENERLTSTLYPNPVNENGRFYIKTEEASGVKTVEFINTVGQAVAKTSVDEGLGNAEYLTVRAEVPAGIYLIRLKDQSGQTIGQSKLQVR